MQMETTVKGKGNRKAEEVKLQNEISSLKKRLADYKADRKSEWKSFKNKFSEDLDKVEKSLNELSAVHKQSPNADK
jgi:hypothetical protein